MRQRHNRKTPRKREVKKKPHPAPTYKCEYCKRIRKDKPTSLNKYECLLCHTNIYFCRKNCCYYKHLRTYQPLQGPICKRCHHNMTDEARHHHQVIQSQLYIRLPQETAYLHCGCKPSSFRSHLYINLCKACGDIVCANHCTHHLCLDCLSLLE